MPLPFSHEIYERILDFLFDDPAALAVCSLISRAWCHSRAHRFSSVALSTAGRAMTVDNPCLQGTIDKFLDILASPLTTLLDHVHKVAFTHSPTPHLLEEWSWTPALIDRLSVMKHIHTLLLVHIPWTVEAIDPTIHAFSGIKSLTLIDTHFPDMFAQGYLLSGLLALQTISLSSRFSDQCHLPLTSLFRDHHQLTSISVITEKDLSFIARALGTLAPSSLPPITTLCVGGVMFETGLRNIQLLLECLGGTLENLEVGLGSGFTPEWTGLVDLSCCLDLKSFAYSWDTPGSEFIDLSFAWFINLLSTLPPTACIQKLQFLCPNQEDDTMPSELIPKPNDGWASRRRVLSQPQFSGLGELLILRSGFGTFDLQQLDKLLADTLWNESQCRTVKVATSDAIVRHATSAGITAMTLHPCSCCFHFSVPLDAWHTRLEKGQLPPFLPVHSTLPAFGVPLHDLDELGSLGLRDIDLSPTALAGWHPPKVTGLDALHSLGVGMDGFSLADLAAIANQLQVWDPRMAGIEVHRADHGGDGNGTEAMEPRHPGTWFMEEDSV